MALCENMPSNSEEDASIKPRELVFLLAIAGRIDAQTRLLAKELNDDRKILHAYNILDALSSSYSMFKYFFEVFISNNNDPVLMHEIMISPEGIAAITAEALFLVAFSFLASYFERDKKDKDVVSKGKKAGDKNGFDAKQFIVAAWPYFRDTMKGMKNAYKGWKTAVQILGLLGAVDLKCMLIPVGLALGAIAAVNRMWLLTMRKSRRQMIKDNKQFVMVIEKERSLSKEKHEAYLAGKDKDKIHHQSAVTRTQAYLSVALSGLIDGLYLYAGLVSLALLPTPAFMAMVAISALYIVICVISRVYDEYCEQLELITSQTKCKLTLVSKELETAYATLLALPDNVELIERDNLQKDIVALIERFEQLHHLLKHQATPSYLMAILQGTKNGLFAYGILAGFLFMVTAVFSVTATVFPPALLIACIASGLAFIIGIIAYNIYAHYSHMQKLKQQEVDPLCPFVDMKNKIKVDITPDCLPTSEFKELLNKAANPECLPKSTFQEWFEILRSFFSGISKGNNFATFVSTPLQDADPQAHEHDAPIMLMLTLSSAALFSVVLALRALARGIAGKDKAENTMDTSQTRDVGEPREPIKEASPDPLPPKPFFLHRWSLFRVPPPKATTSQPPPLTRLGSCPSIVQGLS